MSISIIQPGMFTTVQDEGRFGFQHLGFRAGAMDLYSYLIGKSLIGNNGPSLNTLLSVQHFNSIKIIHLF